MLSPGSVHSGRHVVVQCVREHPIMMMMYGVGEVVTTSQLNMHMYMYKALQLKWGGAYFRADMVHVRIHI